LHACGFPDGRFAGLKPGVETMGIGALRDITA
jgi:hypothetical protein